MFLAPPQAPFWVMGIFPLGASTRPNSAPSWKDALHLWTLPRASGNRSELEFQLSLTPEFH